jgi:hypothetical protein
MPHGSTVTAQAGVFEIDGAGSVPTPPSFVLLVRLSAYPKGNLAEAWEQTTNDVENRAW